MFCLLLAALLCFFSPLLGGLRVCRQLVTFAMWQMAPLGSSCAWAIGAFHVLTQLVCYTAVGTADSDGAICFCAAGGGIPCVAAACWCCGRLRCVPGVLWSTSPWSLNTFLWCFGVVVVVAAGRVGVFSGVFSCGEVLVASALLVAKRASSGEGIRPGFCISV